MKLQSNRFKEGGTIKGGSRYKKVIWTLTTEDFEKRLQQIF
jgi:hypothetical protein